MEPKNTYWKRNLTVMFFVQFVLMAGFNIFTPFLPLFITSDLGIKDARAAAIWSGIVLATPGLLAAFVSPFWGSVGDKIGRKPMVLRATIAIVAVTALMSTSRNVYELTLYRVIQGSLAGYSATVLGLMASTSPREKLAFSLGWLQTGLVLGGVLGPFIGGLVADYFSYRRVFQLTSVLAAICVLLVWSLVREEFTRVPETRSRPLLDRMARTFRMETIGTLFLVILITQFAIRSLEPALPLFVREIMSDDTSGLNTLAGSAFAVSGITQALAIMFIPWGVKSLGYHRLLFVALLGMAFFYFPHGLAQNPGQLLFARLAAGLFLGAVIPVANALIGLKATDETKGEVYGVTQSAHFLGNFSGPLVGGVIVAFMGSRAVFYITSGLLFLCAWWVHRSLGRSEKKAPLPPALADHKQQ